MFKTNFSAINDEMIRRCRAFEDNEKNKLGLTIEIIGGKSNIYYPDKANRFLLKLEMLAAQLLNFCYYKQCLWSKGRKNIQVFYKGIPDLRKENNAEDRDIYGNSKSTALKNETKGTLFLFTASCLINQIVVETGSLIKISKDEGSNLAETIIDIFTRNILSESINSTKYSFKKLRRTLCETHGYTMITSSSKSPFTIDLHTDSGMGDMYEFLYLFSERIGESEYFLGSDGDDSRCKPKPIMTMGTPSTNTKRIRIPKTKKIEKNLITHVPGLNKVRGFNFTSSINFIK